MQMLSIRFLWPKVPTIIFLSPQWETYLRTKTSFLRYKITLTKQNHFVCFAKNLSISYNFNWIICFSVLKFLEKFVKTEIIISRKAISLAFLSQLHGQDRNDRKAREQLKERFQIIFPELFLLFINNNAPQIVIANINNILCRDFIHSSKEKMFRFVPDEVWTDIQNMMLAAPSLPWWPKPKDPFFTRPTATKVFDKFSRAASVNHPSYNWRNGEATYSAILMRYYSFGHCKIHFAWYEISVSFYFS